MEDYSIEEYWFIGEDWGISDGVDSI